MSKLVRTTLDKRIDNGECLWCGGKVSHRRNCELIKMAFKGEK